MTQIKTDSPEFMAAWDAIGINNSFFYYGSINPDDLAAALRAYEDAKPSPWQPIETAPKGDVVWAIWSDNKGTWADKIWWDDAKCCWCTYGGVEVYPTYWHRLPDFPRQGL